MGSSKRQEKQSGISECSRALREFIVDAAGGFSEIGRVLGVARQQVNHWRDCGFPLQRCPEIAQAVFGDAKLRWALNFEAIYAYEKPLAKERGHAKVIPMKTYWNAVIEASPLSKEEKGSLRALYERKVKSKTD